MTQKLAKSAGKNPALSARQQRHARGCGGCLAGGFAFVFLGAGCAMLFFLTLRPWFGMLQARSWAATPCTIISSDAKAIDGDSLQLTVVFKYTVDKNDYQSDTYCFSSMSSNTANNWKQQVVRDHPAGKQTTCFVNPGNPAEAVIERGWVPDMWWGLFPIPFLLVGGGALLVAVGVIRFPQSNATNRWQAARSVSPVPAATLESRDLSEPADGPVTLEPASTPLGNLIGSLVFAVFWNGIVSIFLWDTIGKLRQGQVAGWGWFEVVFLVPFVLVGVGAIGFVFYTLLTLFNPRPTLTIDSAAIPLGESLRLTWNLSGRLSSINQFKISLKGVEKATYRRGTDTTTDTETFAEIPIFETTEMFEMAEGAAEVIVPDDTMHSFDAPNNKIQWTLEVHGVISLWPDVAASFPITILPKPLEEDA